MPDESLTVAEVASLLKLNQQTIRNMIDRGQLGAVRVGKRRVRVRQSQLDAFLAAGEMPYGPDPQMAASEEQGRWQAVRDAVGSVATTAEEQDRDALEQAIS